MGKITVLNEEISSKIAAGEVIERPYSVVKEMVENSIDAGSFHITIEIEKGGKKLIRVLDDGEGMSPEDVKLAFLRHATSKISKLDDIFNISTLGFRGEALASIASVSKVLIITKTQEDEIGTLCEIHGGNQVKFQEAAAQKGCLIEVRDLFYNTPARFKFLSNDSKETSLIVNFISKMAIGNPEISFRLICDGKELIATSGNGDAREVLARIYGSDLAKKVIDIKKEFDYGKIEGFIATPQFCRGNRNGEIFFVNRRLIQDRALSFCIERAYKTLLPIGKFPFCVIFLQIKASEIDVNIHPSKTQVKFTKQNEVEQFIYYTVSNALKQTVLVPEEKFSFPFKEKNQETSISLPAFIKKEVPQKIKNDINIDFLNVVYSGSNSERIKEGISDGVEEPSEIITIYETSEINKSYMSQTSSSSLEKSGLKIRSIIGQIFDTYIIAEGETQIYIIDQHAAHERILFDSFNSSFKQSIASQIIAPSTLKLTPNEMILAESYLNEINQMGFDVSIFGNDTVLIRSVPCYFNKTVEPETLKYVLQEFEGGEFQRLNDKEKLMASMACHTAVRANKSLTQTEMRELISQLQNTTNPYTCPHGRPTMISMTIYELEKKFKRIL